LIALQAGRVEQFGHPFSSLSKNKIAYKLYIPKQRKGNKENIPIGSLQKKPPRTFALSGYNITA
tara:strand:+ start:1439 stop:1630 length:192 start_codon:yes stop_codon:yes gene_type:complete